MEKKSYIGKIAMAIFVLLVAGHFAVIFLLMTALSGKVHYIPLIIAAAAILYIGFVLQIFDVFYKKSKRVKIFWIIAGIILAVCSIQPMYKWIDSRVPTVDAEVDIYQYEPFTDRNKLVQLEQAPKLKLEEPLPKIDGATALYPLYAAITQHLYPNKEYNPYNSEVMVNQTHEAYTNLILGNTDMIFVAGPSDQQVKHAEQNGIKLHLTPIGKEAFVFFVNSKNGIDNLSLEQIKGIYTGEITNWSEVGGKDDAIRAFQRPQDSGSQTALQRLMENTPLMEAPSEDIATGMGGIINEVSQYKNYRNAIGYTFRYYSNEMVKNKEIKLLEIDGIAPTRETIRTNTYPIASEFYIVTAGEPTGNVKAVIDWVLSDEGQALVEKAGYVSLSSIE
ncbi:PstS family phosphate ABC transporter substrate-binding protein [Solibacillus silvestris]|uniref:PstS family phosphate ABC transporter substrate-binding protein n=1 Tax=Solibacillus silvestris TaxID=76853 RepID=UPI003F7CF243